MLIFIFIQLSEMHEAGLAKPPNKSRTALIKPNMS